MIVAPVKQAVISWFSEEANNGGYETFDRRHDEMVGVSKSIAALIACDVDEVALTTSSSESWWRAFSAVPLHKGDRVVLGRAEFVAAAAGLFQAAARGVELVVVPNDSAGRVDLEALSGLVDERVKLACLTEVPMTRGVINPIREAIDIIRGAGDPMVIVDGTQAVGQIPTDVRALGCDFYTATGRKWLRGPRGTGFLYARAGLEDRLLPPVFVDGAAGLWSDEYAYAAVGGAARYTFGERPWAALRGLGEAVDYALDIGPDNISARIAKLAAYGRERLAELPGVLVHDGPEAATGIISITVDGTDAVEAVKRLRAEQIHTAAPGRGASFHDLAERDLDAIIRVSPHYYNTEAELDQLVTALAAW